MIEEAGLQGSPRDLFAEIERQRPDLTPAFIETLIGAGEPQRYPWLDTFLRATFLRDPSAGEALAQRLFALGNLNAGIAVANALVYVSPRADQDWAIRSHHLHTLLTHEDAGLRLAGASVLPYFRNADLHAAVSALVLAANVGTDAVMADKLYSALPNDLADLDDATREALAVKLVPLSALEYWPMTYLSRLATTHSRLVLEVVADRLFSDRPYKEYQALPFGDHNMNPIVQGLTASPTFADDLREVMRERAGADDAALSRFTGFLGHIAREAPDLVRGMIDEAIASDNGGLQRAALRWVRNLPHDMIEEDVPWVVGLLERAHAISPEMGQHAQSAIFAELITGAENVGHYEGAPSDMRAQAIAQEALARDDLSVAVRRFFTDLAEHGRRAEDATINRAEEAFGTQ
jgi:hypothetical protein